jgi:hypothetical protein
VKDAEEADRCPEVMGVSGDLDQRGGARAKEEVIQERGVAAAQGMERVQTGDNCFLR